MTLALLRDGGKFSIFPGSCVSKCLLPRRWFSAIKLFFVQVADSSQVPVFSLKDLFVSHELIWYSSLSFFRVGTGQCTPLLKHTGTVLSNILQILLARSPNSS